MPIVKNRDLTVDDGQLDRLAHERRLLGVLARNGDTGVARAMVSGRVVATTMYSWPLTGSVKG